MNNKVLDIYRPKNETLNDAFDRLVVTIHHQRRMFGHKTFVLTGCEPSVGTTTIAINVAISLALSGLKTILIDGDLRKDTKYKRLNDEVELGLTDVLVGNSDLASVICATNYTTLDYLPSGTKDENPVGLLYSPNLNKIIASINGYYDFVIFDLPSANAAIDSNIFASKVDAVILVAKQNSTTTLQIKNAKKELDKIAANLVGIVFNDVDRTEYRHYMKNYDYFNKEKFLGLMKKNAPIVDDSDDDRFELQDEMLDDIKINNKAQTPNPPNDKPTPSNASMVNNENTNSVEDSNVESNTESYNNSIGANDTYGDNESDKKDVTKSDEKEESNTSYIDNISSEQLDILIKERKLLPEHVAHLMSKGKLNPRQVQELASQEGQNITLEQAQQIILSRKQ